MNIKLSIIIPVFNEQTTILEILKKIFTALNGIKIQIIVVNDGSTDNTWKILQTSEYFLNPVITFLNHKTNLGKGSAIKNALKQAIGEYTIIQDADLEYDPKDIVKLLDFAEQKKLTAVYGSRNLNPQTPRGTFLFYYGGRILSYIASFLYLQKISDEPTCYKLFETKTLKSLPLTCQGFEFCPEVTALISKKGFIIHEQPINYNPRGIQQGKKIHWQDWFVAVWTLFYLRFSTEKKWFLALLLFLLAFFVYLSTWAPIFMGYEKETAQSAIDLSNGNYQVFRAGIGAIFLYMPFVYLTKLFAFEHTFKILSLVPIFYSALITPLYFNIFKNLGFKTSSGLIATVLISLATLIWPYSRIGMEYQTTLLLTWLFYEVLKFYEKPKRQSIFLGLVLMLLCITKSYGAVFALPLTVAIFPILKNFYKNSKKDFFKLTTKIFLPSSLSIVILALVNHIVFAQINGVYFLAQEFHILNWWEGFYGVFFSFGKGLFVYSPLLLLSLFFWKRFFSNNKNASLFVVLSFCILLFLTAPFSFWSDETLSVRKLVPVLPLLHLPIILYFEQVNKRLLNKILVALLIITSLYAQFVNSLYPYYRQLEFLRPYNLDTLTEVRYNPAVSHLALNSQFFWAYAKNSQTHNFYYLEKTWMRCCTLPSPAENKTVTRIAQNLNSFATPEIFFKTAREQKSLNIFSGLVFTGLFTSLFFIAINIYNFRKLEKS